MTHNNGQPWTADEDAYLREHYTAQGASQTAAELGRTRRSVQQRALLLKISAPAGKHPWRCYPKPPPAGP